MARLVFAALALVASLLISLLLLGSLKEDKEEQDDTRMASTGKAAVFLGSTGAVGQRLLDELLESPSFSTVVTLVRKPGVNKNRDKLVEHVVKDMNQVESEVQAAIQANVKEAQVVGFSTVGVGHGTGFMSIADHRAVDVELNSHFAQGLKASGKVDHLVFMSSAGANPNSWDWGWGGAGFPRYNRVKGEAEEAVKKSGIPHVSIFRPAAILGIPNTPRIMEYVSPMFAFMTPAELTSVWVKDLAKSMAMRGAQDVSKDSEPSRIFHYRQMMELVGNQQ